MYYCPVYANELVKFPSHLTLINSIYGGFTHSSVTKKQHHVPAIYIYYMCLCASACVHERFCVYTSMYECTRTASLSALTVMNEYTAQCTAEGNTCSLPRSFTLRKREPWPQQKTCQRINLPRKVLLFSSSCFVSLVLSVSVGAILWYKII